jgi:predicted ATP-dependent endonuclease of OLD family
MKNPSFGLRWRKLDLHVHTPASRDYTGPPINAEDFVRIALSKGVEGIGITDHNTGGWIEKIQEAAKPTSLAVFPGVEISCGGGLGGIHIIALFDRTETQKTVESLLAKLKIEPKDHGNLDAITPISLEQVIETIAEMGGIAVLAHADSSKGVLSDIKGEARTRVIRCPDLSAAELCNYEKSSRYLDGTDPTYKRRLASYRASDNPSPNGLGGHSADGIASRFSWFKTDGMTLNCLRQCFADSAIRIVPDVVSHPVPTQMYPRIHSLNVSQGFLSGSTFEFHEGLNSVIGGKGVGKSLLVEVIRFGLDQTSPVDAIQEDMWGKLTEQVGIGGVIRIEVQIENNRRVLVERTFDRDENPILVSDMDSGDDIDAHIGQFFPVLAYSQTEALAIAKDPRAQLQLIDTLLDLEPLANRIVELQKELQETDKSFVASMEATAILHDKEKDVKTLTQRLDRIDRALKSDRHDELKKLEPKSNWLEGIAASFEGLANCIEDAIESVDATEIPDLEDATRSDTELASLHKKIKKLKVRALADSRSLKSDIAALNREAAKTQAEWRKHVTKCEADYRKWAEQQGGDRPKLASTRKRLQGDLAKAEKTLKATRFKAVSHDGLEKSREKLLVELQTVRNEMHERRIARYAEIQAASGKKLELSLARNADRDTYLGELLSLKKGTSLQESTIKNVAQRVEPGLLVRYVQVNDFKSLTKAAQITEQQAKRLIDHLRGLETFEDVLAMEYMDLCFDKPSIRYRKDDGVYYGLDSLSIGQKCTALLIIALADGSRPVIIDQPEDALDTSSVYEDVTMQLRTKKERRQFILTTHNSTVAVAGDTDHFQVLAATATQASITSSGAIDRPKIVGHVVQHLEGGREPFDLKSKKYGSSRS